MGYFVGLGDRHASNILIDQTSGELVHIDLGIAFEQGRLLPMPERIPYRLTREMVDGMGGEVGVNGTFRRCCEETMRVMRGNQDAIMTILEVLVHDPLFKWTVDPVKALKVQRPVAAAADDPAGGDSGLEDAMGGAGGGSEAAHAGWRPGGRASETAPVEAPEAGRIMLRVKDKLLGREGDEAFSVEGHVKQLINEARDPMNLALAFPGWSAWL